MAFRQFWVSGLSFSMVVVRFWMPDLVCFRVTVHGGGFWPFIFDVVLVFLLRWHCVGFVSFSGVFLCWVLFLCWQRFVVVFAQDGRHGVDCFSVMPVGPARPIQLSSVLFQQAIHCIDVWVHRPNQHLKWETFAWKPFARSLSLWAWVCWSTGRPVGSSSLTSRRRALFLSPASLGPRLVGTGAAWPNLVKPTVIKTQKRCLGDILWHMDWPASRDSTAWEVQWCR